MNAKTTVACIVLLTLPTVAAHEPSDAVLEPGTYLHHTERYEGSLAPGGWNNTTLAFGGTHLQDSWFLLWSGEVTGGTLEATVQHDDQTVHAWTWPGDEEGPVVHGLDETGFHELHLHNPGPDPVGFTLYYDNTCDCTSKVAQGARSPLWFNYDLPRPGPVGWDVSFVPHAWPPGRDLPPVGDVGVTAHVANWNGPGDHWPTDFDITRTFELDLPPRGDEPMWTVDMGFTAEAAGTNYILMTVYHDGHPDWRFQVRPVPDLPDVQATPGPGMVGLLAAIAVVGVLANRRRLR